MELIFFCRHQGIEKFCGVTTPFEGSSTLSGRDGNESPKPGSPPSFPIGFPLRPCVPRSSESRRRFYCAGRILNSTDFRCQRWRTPTGHRRVSTQFWRVLALVLAGFAVGNGADQGAYQVTGTWSRCVLQGGTPPSTRH